MSRFSTRYGYDPRITAEPILEDAPERTRSAYINGILGGLLFIDLDDRYKNAEDKPLGIKTLYVDFCALLRTDPADEGYDSWYCQDTLYDLIRSCEWYGFYDFIELVGRKLKDAESFHVFEDDWVSVYGFQTYQRKINELFTEERIGWRLSEDSELRRDLPTSLSKRLDAVNNELQNEFTAARNHYKKALRYIYERPIDPENSIKEIISAIESIGKKMYPGTSTLGDVIKELRKANIMPKTLASMLEKFYAFASSEPAIRHGAPVPSTVSTADAEFCLHVGVAMIRYILAKNT